MFANELDPELRQWAEDAAARNFGDDWRTQPLKPMAEYFAELIEPAPLVPTKFEGDWFTIQTQPQHERIVAAGLIAKKFPMYLPMRKCKVRVRAGQRHRVVEKPMLPGYVLVSFAGDGWNGILSIAGVIDILSWKRTSPEGVVAKHPVRVPLWALLKVRDKEIELATGKATLRIDGRELEVGHTVFVADGPFQGFFGKVTAVLVKRERVQAEIDIFGRMTKADFEVEQLQLV